MYNKAVTFSYDDGITQDIKLVELFNKYGLKATFNLNTGIQTRESDFDILGKKIYRLNQDEIGDLYRGHEIATHGLKHLAPENMSESELEEEFLTDILNITKLYGERPVGMAYAYGAYDTTTVEWLREHGIKYGRTVGSTHSFSLPKEPLLLEATCHHNDENLFELADKFINYKPKEDEKLLFYVWGHSYEFYANDNWDRIEKLCQLLSGRDDIFFGTNRQCLEMFGVI